MVGLIKTKKIAEEKTQNFASKCLGQKNRKQTQK